MRSSSPTTKTTASRTPLMAHVQSSPMMSTMSCHQFLPIPTFAGKPTSLSPLIRRSQSPVRSHEEEDYATYREMGPSVCLSLSTEPGSVVHPVRYVSTLVPCSMRGHHQSRRGKQSGIFRLHALQSESAKATGNYSEMLFHPSLDQVLRNDEKLSNSGSGSERLHSCLRVVQGKTNMKEIDERSNLSVSVSFF